MFETSSKNRITYHLRKKRWVNKDIKKMRSILESWYGEEEGERRAVSYMPVTVKLGDVINNILRDVNKKDGTLLDLLRSHWFAMTGSEVSSNSRPISIRDRILYIEAKSNVWLSELKNFYGRLIEEKVKAFCGDAVSKIIFLPPSK